jgi:hypothetical protein
MLLTDPERRKFAQYLRQDAQSNRTMARMLEGMGIEAGMTQVLHQKKIQDAEAEERVAAILESTSSETITG